MWIAKQSKRATGRGRHAQMGVVTAQGEQVGVYADGYQQLLPVAAPGGYRWRPKNGQRVLVMKSGADGEAACILAQQEETDAQLRPGEAELYADGCSVKLKADGKLELNGTVLVNGVSVEALIETAVQQALARQEGT